MNLKRGDCQNTILHSDRANPFNFPEHISPLVKISYYLFSLVVAKHSYRDPYYLYPFIRLKMAAMMSMYAQHTGQFLIINVNINNFNYYCLCKRQI